MLMRHGASQEEVGGRMAAADFRGWVARYRLAGITGDSRCERAATIARECAVVACSDLPRSLESAARLEAHNVVVSDNLLREIDLPHGSGRWPTPALPISVWLITFRLLWLFGYHGHAESRHEVRIRIRHAADRLVALARDHHSVLFVGHALFNQLLARELLARGWLGPRRPGSSHWQYGVYAWQAVETTASD
ncbi:histidine phosphatase family protein [Kushneria aurantia]|uniref:Histidine phosphatase family protein n=1 Tax=Kushneria aurantia TaxID=504092 RepID=A0ABV6G144_9GAMM|nr:histidine phosphatase family protein [Kushneria aurantia]